MDKKYEIVVIHYDPTQTETRTFSNRYGFPDLREATDLFDKLRDCTKMWDTSIKSVYLLEVDEMKKWERDNG